MTILENILEYKKTEVEKQKKICSFEELINKCKNLPESKSFLNILKKNKENRKISLIAEVKKASPSKGIIKEDFNPVEIAKIYQKAGASAISVLTDEKFFQGSIQYLKDVKNIVEIPVLRKDFIIDEYQVYQTREMGADIILLIASALEKSQLKNFYTMSKELGLDVLLEVHDKEEFNFALEINADIVGINNRNLKTFEVSLNNTINLIKDIKLNNSYIISESGIKNYEAVKFLQSYGVAGILVGESLIKSVNIEKSVIDLLK
jgi:indole-3-glycerol phosphate synthase